MLPELYKTNSQLTVLLTPSPLLHTAEVKHNRTHNLSNITLCNLRSAFTAIPFRTMKSAILTGCYSYKQITQCICFCGRLKVEGSDLDSLAYSDLIRSGKLHGSSISSGHKNMYRSGGVRNLKPVVLIVWFSFFPFKIKILIRVGRHLSHVWHLTFMFVLQLSFCNLYSV